MVLVLISYVIKEIFKLPPEGFLELRFTFHDNVKDSNIQLYWEKLNGRQGIELD